MDSENDQQEILAVDIGLFLVFERYKENHHMFDYAQIKSFQNR